MAEKGIREQIDGRLLELQVSVIHQIMRSMGHFHMPCQNCVFAQLNPLEYHILLFETCFLVSSSRVSDVISEVWNHSSTCRSNSE